MGAAHKIAHRRVVLDTNVVLSALLFSRGSLSPLREAWQDGRLVPLASRDTVAELLRALAYPKFKLSAGEQEDLLAEYLPWCQSVAVARSLRVPRCRDVHDEAFLRLARAGDAELLITGDEDLLSMAAQFAVRIVRPGELLAQLAAAPR